MKKLFVAIGFADNLAQEAAPWVKKLRKTADTRDIELKWTPSENYHVTLLYLGPTPAGNLEKIKQGVDAAAKVGMPFDLKLRGLGAFPELDSGRVIYFDVQRSQTLMALQEELAKHLHRESSEDANSYSPHMTLARLRNPKSCRDLLSPFRHADLGKQRVIEIVLFESIQAGLFPKYIPLLRVPLTGKTQHPIRHRTSVVVIQDGKILGFHAQDPTSGKKYFFLPGGKIEKGETAAGAAVRETMEETGYSIQIKPNTEHLEIYNFEWNGQINECHTAFMQGELTPGKQSPHPVKDADYHQGVGWTSIDEIERTFSYHPAIIKVIREIIQEKT